MLNVTLPIAGYVPGQSIPISLTIDNESREGVEEITFKLKKIVRCFSQTPRVKCKEEKRVVVMKRSLGVEKHQKKVYQHNLLIPALPPTNLDYCKIIQISYVLKIKPKVSGMHRDNKLSIPIVIGTVPLTPGNAFPTQAVMNRPLGFVNNGADLNDDQRNNIPLSSMTRPNEAEATAPPASPQITCVPSYDNVARDSSYLGKFSLI